MVVLKRVLAHLLMKKGLIIKNWLQRFLAKAISIDMHKSLVGVLSRFAEEMLVGTDYCLWT